MHTVQVLARYATFPLFFFGINDLLIALIGAAAPWWQPLAALPAASALLFVLSGLVVLFFSFRPTRPTRRSRP